MESTIVSTNDLFVLVQGETPDEKMELALVIFCFLLTCSVSLDIVRNNGCMGWWN